MSGTTEDSASRPPELSVPVLKIKDLPSVSKDWKNVELPVDFLILALEDWECLAFLSQLNDDFYKSFHRELGFVYFGNVRGDEKMQNVAVVKSRMLPDLQGRVTVVPNAVKILRPKAVFHVGACAGLEEVKRGDVVLSAEVKTYAYTKDAKGGFEERVVAVPPSRRLSKVAINAAAGWEAPLKNPTELNVKVHHGGVVLSGPRVVNSFEQMEELMKRFSDEVSLEMEGEGLYEAAHDLRIEWISIKGVSDFAGREKANGDPWRPFSSVMAASLTAHILRDTFAFQDWPHYSDEGWSFPKGMEIGFPSSSIESVLPWTEKHSTAGSSFPKIKIFRSPHSLLSGTILPPTEKRSTAEQDMPESQLEYQTDKAKIHEGIVTRAGTIWNLKQGAAYLIFPPDAVSEPTSIVVNKWKCSTRSPPLQEHEALVSNVIEISTKPNRALEFNVEVTLFLCHSAADLQGYELVLRRLVNNEWKYVDGTQALRHFSEIEDEHPTVKDVPDVFPAVQAEIIECSTYAVVSRLKSSPLYTVTSDGGSFNHPNYPGVLITIPKKAVPPKGTFNLQVKVQEVLSEAFDDENVMVGPILRIACSQSIEFLKPVIIQLPVSHQHGGISQSLECRVRVLFLRSDGVRKKWIEITDDLENPPNYDGKFVTFQVERFSGYSYILDWSKVTPIDSRILRALSSLIWNPPRRAVFFAYVFSSSSDEEYVLRLICCPNHLGKELTFELERKRITFSTIKSFKKMVPEYDKAFVCVSGRISPINVEDMNDFHLVFDGDDWCDRQLPVRVISDQTLSKVQFHSTSERAVKDRLAELYLRVDVDREALNNPQSIHDPGTSTENPGNRGLAFGCTSDSRKRKRKLATKGSSADYHEDRGFAFACTSAAKQSKLASEVTKFDNRSKDDLERLSRKIADNWKPLARRLGFDEPKITAFDQENGRLARKAHPMLLAWHRREGSAATYQVLYDALCHELVECKALAEELCYS